MLRHILTINITNELDVVLAYKRAIQLSERLGMAQANQTKFATAVSEIGRNVVEHVGSGSIRYSLADEGAASCLEASIADRGRGIGNLSHILTKTEPPATGRGSGIPNSKRLVDYFHIESAPERGTTVTLRKRLPALSPDVRKQLLDTWVRELDQELNISPYAEIKRQNVQLLELLDQLHARNVEAEQQLEEIRRLNTELQQSNSEISTLLEEREQKNDLLQLSNENLDAFAHTVTHDLRAPLQNIYGIATALEACIEAGQREEALLVLPLLRQQTQKMDRLITGILAYSLAGRQSIQKNNVELESLLHQVIMSLNIPSGFQVEIQEDLPTLHTEEIFLFQVFSNILGNSIKHHDRPAEAVVRISGEVQGAAIVFTIADNGPGIPADKQQEVLHLYESDSTVSRPFSSGLGLSIVNKIIEVKAGKLWIESEGRGTSFKFTWPASEIVPASPT